MSHLLRKWVTAGLSAGVLAGAGCQDEQNQQRPSVAVVASGEPVYNTVGKLMPPDAAPLDQQSYRFLVIEPSTLDANIAIYQAQSGIFPFEGLGRLNHNFELVPAAAERWESNDAGDKWTFYLRKDGKWSDGRPVTAQDFEYTFKRAIDPASANVYAFFYYPIKGAKAFNQGKTKNRDSVGVTAIDEHTLVIETEGPCPYLPQLTAFTGSGAVPQWQVEKYGPKWTEPENCVTNSSFMVDSWDHGRQMEYVLNPHYNGSFKAYLERVTAIFIGAETDAGHLPYEEGEVDYQVVTSREVPALRGNPELRDQLHIYSTFRTRFLIFDDQKKPYSDLRVRQAISHAVDREVLANVVMQGTASAAYSMLPPGFPGDAGSSLDNIQRFDPEMGRQLLAEAGYPGGRGFPKKEMVLRGTEMKQEAQAIQQMLKDNLNIDLPIKILEAKAYSTALMQWEMPLSLGGFSQDFPDAHNMLSMVWRSQPKPFGRQPWKNGEFDRLVDSAAVEMDHEKRMGMYADAQKILAEDVGAVFLFYQKEASLRKPWLKGIKENSIGEYPFRNYMDMYIGQGR